MALGPLLGTSYSLTRLLGTGGTGEVFEATHDALGKRVAIKLLRPEVSNDPELLDRLRAEARILTRISHPALAQVFDLGETADGRLFFAMEYIEGETAASMLARGPLPLACDIMAEVLDGLAAAHAVGVVHRDIKPSNIIVGADGRARVIDFGVATIADAPVEGDLPIGTPNYMAPEQILAHPTSFATDLYAAACTLFVLVTGTPLFGSKDVLERHVRDAPPTLSERLSQPVSTSLEALVARALAKDPHERPRSASEMAADLRRIARPNDATREAPAPRVSRANVRELPTKFHGRQRELEILSDKFSNGERVVTLLGPGGCGKTRLAKRFATLQIPSYDDAGGVWFVALEDARSASDVVTRVARVIGAPVSSARDEEGALVHLGSFIASRGPMFLVLDNCEQAPADVARVIARWMEQAPQSRFLATSRERLGLSIEHAYEIEPLLEDDAVQLFVDRARLARADYSVTNDDAPVLFEIVRALDGIPLAIELAAARMRMMSASVLRDRLSERFEILASSARDVPARQRTLLAAIDWSWSLLDRVEQSALAQLSVFRGGFTLDAAEAVVDLSASTESVLDVVQRLRDKSLVYAQGSRDFPSEVRLGLYESIRDFAARKGDVGAARDRHTAYFVQRGADWARRADIGSAEHLRRLVLEFDNLRSVRARALEQNRLRDALSITNTILMFLSARGAPLTVRIELANSMIATPGVDSEPGLLAGILYYRAYALRYVGATDQALDDAKAILELGARDPMAEFRGHMVLTYFGNAEERIAHAEAAVRTSRSLEPPWHQQALNMLAMAHLDAGHHEVAREMYGKVIPLSDAAGNRKVSAQSRSALGILLLELGRLEDAERVLEEGLALTPNFGHVEVRRYNLALVRHERGDYEQAESDYRDVIASAQGNVLACSLAKAALGALLAARDQIDQATKLLAEAERDLPKTSLYQDAIALHRGHLDLACARKAEREGDAESSKQHRLAAERRLDKEFGLEDDVRTARRWLERALHPTASDAADAWAIASDGSWFRRPQGWRVDVGSRAHAKLVLAALVHARLDPSRPSLSVDDVLQAGWPGERVMRRAAEARVYNIINALRKLGLRDLIVSTENGYALDPAQRVSSR